MRRSLLVLSLLLLPLLSACASAQRSAEAPGVFTEEVGPATVGAVEREAMPILQRFGYTIQRTERTTDRISIETIWVNRPPHADEASAGAREVRTRVLLATRPRSTTNSAGSHVSGVTLRLEVEHRDATDNWVVPTARSAEMVAVARRIMEAFRLEFQVKGLEG